MSKRYAKLTLNERFISKRKGGWDHNYSLMNTWAGGLIHLHTAISDKVVNCDSNLTEWATPLLCCDSCAFWTLSTLSDPSLHAPQLSVIIIQSRLPCPLPHLLLFFSFFPSHLCVSPANLSRQTPYQPVFSSDTAVAPSSQQRKNCTFHTISSLTWSHFSHQSFSSSLLWCQLYCLRQIPVRGCVDAGVNMKTNSCWKQAYVKIGAADCWLFLICCGLVPVLYHDHGHPVRGIHMFPNQVLEKQEWLHQEILQRMDVGKNERMSLYWQIEMSAAECRFVLTTRSEVPVKVSIYVV